MVKIVKSTCKSSLKPDFTALVPADFQFHDSNYKVSAAEVVRNHQDLLEAILHPDICSLIRSFELHISDTKNKVPHSLAE